MAVQTTSGSSLHVEHQQNLCCRGSYLRKRNTSAAQHICPRLQSSHRLRPCRASLPTSRQDGTSSIDTMPSVFKKIFHTSYPGGKHNPYADPEHPSNPNYYASPSSIPASHNFKPQQLPPRPASPRDSHDYLAEARQAVGRDPVTGKRISGRSSARSKSAPGANRAPAAARSVQNETGAPGGPGGSRRNVVASTERNEGDAGQIGTRYDMFVQEMRGRERGGWREPEGGYYAPERRVGEFYAPPGQAFGRGRSVGPGETSRWKLFKKRSQKLQPS